MNTDNMPKGPLFKNKYRIPSIRKPNWDYRTDGYYFVTICTYMRQHFFGEIKNRQMVLSDVGQICHDEWINTTAIRNNVILDEFVIMPDHAHFLVVIDNGDDEQIVDAGKTVTADGDEQIVDGRKTVFRRDEAQPRLFTTGFHINNEHDTTAANATNSAIVFPPTDDWIAIHNQNQPVPDIQRISPKPGSLGAIIGTYKSVCTRRIRQLGYSQFMWQERYHDSIVTDEIGVCRVRQYIRNNPAKWGKT